MPPPSFTFEEPGWGEYAIAHSKGSRFFGFASLRSLTRPAGADPGSLKVKLLPLQGLGLWACQGEKSAVASFSRTLLSTRAFLCWP